MFIPIVPFLLHPLFHSAAWKVDVIAGILAITLGHEDKDNALEMVEGLEEAVPPRNRTTLADLDTYI